MLIEFTVGNFRSFRDSVTFSMVAANITEKNKKSVKRALFLFRRGIKKQTQVRHSCVCL